jgi:hypothetical protein
MFEKLFLTDLSELEGYALRSYKSASDTVGGREKCFDLNRELRDGRRLEDLDDEIRAIAGSLDSIFKRCPRLTVEATIIPPFLMGPSRRVQAAVFSFIAGVMPPMPMLGRSLL